MATPILSLGQVCHRDPDSGDGQGALALGLGGRGESVLGVWSIAPSSAP
jgi:hypothetical protein